MPLSEEEQRILKQIEEQFYEDDPKFAQHVGASSLYRHALRRIRWGIFGVIAGLVALVGTLQIDYRLSFAAFLVMLGCAFLIERNVRVAGRVGLQDLAGIFRRPAPRLRDRFRR